MFDRYLPLCSVPLVATTMSVLLVVSACGDDTSAGDATADATDTRDASGDVAIDAVDEDSVGDDASDTAQTDTADAGDDDGTARDVGGDDATTVDAEEDTSPPMRSCGRIEPAENDSALYDIIAPLVPGVAEAEVTKTGDALVVDIIDDSDRFEGTFEEGESCLATEVEDLPITLCFYDATGTLSEPGALGTQIAAFLGETSNPNAGVIAAQRRGVDRDCTPSGHYDVEVSVSERPGTEHDLIEPLIAAWGELLTYIAIYDFGRDEPELWWGEEPRLLDVTSVDFETGTFGVSGVTSFDLDDPEGGEEIFVDAEMAATIETTYGEDALSATFVVTFEPDDGSDATLELSFSVTGTRP